MKKGRFSAIVLVSCICVGLCGCSDDGAADPKETLEVSETTTVTAATTLAATTETTAAAVEMTIPLDGISEKHTFGNLEVDIPKIWDEDVIKDKKYFYYNDDCYLFFVVSDLSGDYGTDSLRKSVSDGIVDGVISDGRASIVSRDEVTINGMEVTKLKVEITVDQKKIYGQSYYFINGSQCVSLNFSQVDRKSNIFEKYINTIVQSAQLIEAPTTTTTEVTTPAPPKAEWYSGGTHKVGTDIPAGEYLLVTTSSSAGYYALKTDSRNEGSDNILHNNNFKNRQIVSVKDGQYLELTRCEAILYSDAPKAEWINGALLPGMYKVGVDIEAGEYKLKATIDSRGYYAVYNSTATMDIISNDNFEGSTYITVSDGQYLEVSRAQITKA